MMAEPALLSVRALAAMLGQPDVVLLDVRGVDFFLGYIPASRRAPLELCRMEVDKLAQELGASRVKVVFICNSGEKCSKHYACEFLQQCARSLPEGAYACQTYVLEGGFQAWESEFGLEPLGRYIARPTRFPGAPHAGLPLVQRRPRRPATMFVKVDDDLLGRWGDADADAVPSGREPFFHPGSRDTATCDSLPVMLERASTEPPPTPLRSSSRSPSAQARCDLQAKVQRWLKSELAAGAHAKAGKGDWRDNAKSGDVLRIRVGESGWRQCLVVNRKDEILQVRYFMSGKSCSASLNCRSEDLCMRPPGGACDEH